MADFKSPSIDGQRYLLANGAMAVALVAFWFAHYSFFTIFLTHAIHGTTGFLFYAVHDNNRNLESPHPIYRYFKVTGLPIILLCPLVSIALASAVVSLRIFVFANHLITALLYFHYCSEGFIWKRNTIHRRFVPIVARAPLSQPIITA